MITADNFSLNAKALSVDWFLVQIEFTKEVSLLGFTEINAIFLFILFLTIEIWIITGEKL